MQLRPTPWIAAIRLAAIVSAIAVAVALALSAFGDIPQTALVVAVIVVGFVVSWIRFGRHSGDHHRGERAGGGPSGVDGDSVLGAPRPTGRPGGTGDASQRRATVLADHGSDGWAMPRYTDAGHPNHRLPPVRTVTIRTHRPVR